MKNEEIKKQYEDLGGNWEDVRKFIKSHPLLIEAIEEVIKNEKKVS